MKYTEAWASVVSQNLNLKIATSILGILSLVLGMTTLKLSFKDFLTFHRRIDFVFYFPPPLDPQPILHRLWIYIMFASELIVF
jgi:hypothetical protein